MSYHRNYIIPLDYGNRREEREFIRAILNRYDRNTLVGCILLVNNHPYALQSLLLLNFEKNHEDFEKWLISSYGNKKKDYRYIFSELFGAISNKGFNVATFCDGNDGLLDAVMSGDANEIFHFPDRSIVNNLYGAPKVTNDLNVFLSHSSRDKKIVEDIFNVLHQAGIRAWFDRYEIHPGDSITQRINQGLNASNLALLFLSKSFLDNDSGWPMQEANFFFQQRIREPEKKFIVINIGLQLDELPPLLRDYRFIDIGTDDAHQQIIDAILHTTL